jgi:gamma-glutamylputrescine oxidase
MTGFRLNNLFTDFNHLKPVYRAEEIPSCASELPAATETIVVGGGLLGLSTALELAEAGHEVVLLEAGGLGEGPSGRSGGQLWPGFEGAYSSMREEYDEALALSAWSLVHEALDFIHRRAATRADRCEFRPGVLLVSKNTSQAKWIENEYGAFQASGLGFVTHVTRDEIRRDHVNTDLYLNGLLYKGDDAGCQYGHLNPLKYLYTVAQLVLERGAILLEDCAATGVRQLPDARYLVTTPKGDLKAENIVLATGVDFLRPSGIDYDTIPRCFVSAQTVILATEPIPEQLAREMVPGDACFCDASSAAMNYGRLIPEANRPGYYRLTLGGADALAQMQVAFEIPKIESEMRAMFPQLAREGIKVESVWAGNCDLSRNSLPFITNPRRGIFHASGFSGQGMVNTALYGKAIAERILGASSNKFEILERLNPAPYSRFLALAWLQALVDLAPSVYQTYLENRPGNQ